MSKIVTLEEAQTEIQEIKGIVRGQAGETGAGFLTNRGSGLGFAALYVWGNREEVWITASPQGNAPRLSDEEAATLLLKPGVRFPRPAGSVKWVSVG